MSVFGISLGKNAEQVELARLISDNSTKIIFATGSAGTGKALVNGTPVLTKDGWKPIENLTLQDRVYGRDGYLHSVLGIFPQGEKEVYRVTFSDRTFVDCCKEHLWTIQTASQRGNRRGEDKENYFPITATLEQIMKDYPLVKDGGNGYNRANIFIPLTKPIHFKEQNHLIPPYVMGCMLGDGYFGEKGNIKFTNADQDILDKVQKLLMPLKVKFVHRSRYDYDLCNDDEYYKYHVASFRNELRRLGLFGKESEDKFIPQEYLFDSIENRIELLKGIVDTDGYCGDGAYDICLKSQQLIQDIKFIAEGLGLTATYSEKETICTNAKNEPKKCGLAYRLHIKASYYIQKIHSSQRREKQWKKPQAWARRAITSIEKLNKKQEMTCITIDSPDHLFITKNCIVTHNTFTTLISALQLQEDKKYSKIIYARNPIQVGEDMGYLPGDIDEKYTPFMGPLMDNLENIARLNYRGGGNQKKAMIANKANELANHIEVCPIAFLRGRSFEDAIVIVDEAQNLDLTALKTVLTRVGTYCKIILLASMNQIDDWRQRRQPICDFQKVQNKLENQPYAASVELKQSMRSPICVEVDNLLGEIDRDNQPPEDNYRSNKIAF